VDARELVERAVRRARAQLAPEDGRRAVADVDDGVAVHGDPVLLDRALGNLVDHAVRHGAGDITIAAAPAVLSVHDDGPGMPPEFLAYAAERFRQHEPSRAGGGTGLGLSLVDAIATAHGAQLRVCSGGHHHEGPAASPELAALPCEHVDRGTTVSILLPRGG
jgi:signal transduction histidine kinase